MIKFKCSACNQKIGVPIGNGGKRVKCPKCGGINVVPDDSSVGESRPETKEDVSSSADCYNISEPTQSCPFCKGTIPEDARKCPLCGKLLDHSSERDLTIPLGNRIPLSSHTSGLAIASFILSLYGVSLLGLIFGLIALNKIKKNVGRLSGHGLALAGTSISAIILVLQIALVSYVFHEGEYIFNPHGISKAYLYREIHFKCTKCGDISMYTIQDLQEMPKAWQTGPKMGPVTLNLKCSMCKNNSFIQTVECPNCAKFIIMMDPSKGLFDDRCPMCHKSFAVAWLEKNYRITRETIQKTR
jgi:hypothetical protein